MGNSLSGRSRASLLSIRIYLFTVLLLALLWSIPSSSPAQVLSVSIPSQTYFGAFWRYNQGDYRHALKDFLREGRGGVKIGTQRWIDSICYHTMTGECYYHLGQYSNALAQYDAALQLYLAFPDWMLRVKFPNSVQLRGTANAVVLPWGRSNNAAKIGKFPTKFPTAIGRVDASNVIYTGGVYQQASFIPINVQEIVRCTALAQRRRLELMGPACEHTQLTKSLITALSARPGPPNSWSQTWVDLMLGLAYASGGKHAQAASTLQRAILTQDQVLHPLSGMAQLELGRLLMRAGDFTTASNLLGEATFSAAIYFDEIDSPDLSVLEEAFRYGLQADLVSGNAGSIAPLLSAAKWANRHKYRHLQASTLLGAAENAAVLNQVKDATGLLSRARGVVSRTTMRSGVIGARLNYLNALVGFMGGKSSLAEKALASALSFQRQGSRWLFQISLVDSMFSRGVVSGRTAMDLYQVVLRDPGPLDWASDPLECLSVLLIPHPLPIEHWFEIAMDRRDVEAAIEIADRARRHRFHSTLPMGGRLLALRWLVGAPNEALTQETILQRQALFAKYPSLANSYQTVARIRTDLSQFELKPEQEDDRRRRDTLLRQLASVTQSQELSIQQLALRRQPAELSFPPITPTSDIQSRIAPGSAILVFFNSRQRIYAFLLTRNRYAQWSVRSSHAIPNGITALLRSMGNYDGNRELTPDELANGQWRNIGQRLLAGILKDSAVDLAEGLEELVIVPDGVLWYLPFEALPLGDNAESLMLGEQVRVRYAPTVSLAVSDRRKHRQAARLAVTNGRLYPRDDKDAAQIALSELKDSIPNITELSGQIPKPLSLFAATIDRVVVYDDIPAIGGAPYAWNVFHTQGRNGVTISQMLQLPWQGPEVIALPGFHTVAESSLKNSSPLGNGNDLFLPTCGLLATGAKTVLITRWRSGGKTNYDIARRFMQGLKSHPPAEALQNATTKTREENLDPAREPRVHRLKDPLGADHPFFWAQFMVIDSGPVAVAQNGLPEIPKLKLPKKPEAKKKPDAKEEVPAPGNRK